ncbi:MAG: hypothetical protein M0P57_02740 [Syntrophales bacterium]|nr:hypothetical protein [Syntrophales bacterium]MDY0044795.1 hypothetical protein [Syntrophales bacterium]
MMHEGFYFDEFEPGQTFKTEGRTITEADLVSFVTRHNYSEPLFMDREISRRRPSSEGRLHRPS